MPNPTAPPPPRVQRAVPEDLDLLVAKALRTGKLRDLSVALHKPQTVAVAPGTPVADLQDEVTDPGDAPEPEPVPAADALGALFNQVQALRAAGGAADALALWERAPELVTALSQELEAEAEEQARVPVILPPIRRRWVLLVAPWEADMDLAALSQAAQIDQATLRMQSRHRYAQVLARSDSRAELEGRAEQIGRLGLAASIIDRETLPAIDAPRVVLRREPDGRWFGTRTPLWQEPVSFDPAAPPPGELLDGLQVSLVVPGDVVVRRYRQSGEGGRMSRKRESTARALGESRRGVLDLHGPGTHVRIVEGITDLRNLPGSVQGSSRRSLVGVQEHLGELFPGLQVLAKRVCQSVERAPGGQSGGPLVTTGWPQFEEHTRLLRVAALGDDP